MQRVGAVGDGDIAQHAHRDDLLFEMERLVLAGDELGHLLIAGGDVAAGRNIDKQRRQHQFQAILVAQIDGVGPGVLDLLELRDLGLCSGGDAGWNRRRAPVPELVLSGSSAEEKRTTEKQTQNESYAR